MTGPDRCGSVLAVTTLWLDGRLSASARAEVEQHMRECAACRAEYRAQARLAQAVARLPREAPAADVTGRAWRSAQGAPQTPGTRAPLLRAAAAAAVLLSTALGSYWLGVGDAPAPSPAVVRSEPRESIAEAAEADDSLAYRRAAQLVLADLATIDRVEPALRQPLLAAQMRAFGLDAWAARPARGDDPDAALRPLLCQLDEALSAEDDTQLLALQGSLRVAPSAAAAKPAAAAPPPQARLEVPRFTRDQAQAVVATFTELPPPDRESLAQLLEAKESFVRGDLDATLERARADAEQRPAQRFRSSYRTMVVLCAGAAGDRALVESLLGASDGSLDQVLRDLPWVDLGGGSISVQFGFGKLGEWPLPASKRDEAIDGASRDRSPPPDAKRKSRR